MTIQTPNRVTAMQVPEALGHGTVRVEEVRLSLRVPSNPIHENTFFPKGNSNSMQASPTDTREPSARAHMHAHTH